MRQAIAKAFPEHGVIGEEFAPLVGAGRYEWILDPIDGTRAFMIGSPMWGTLIALTDHGRPVLGVMNQPFTRERFWAAGGVARMQGPHGPPTAAKNPQLRAARGRGSHDHPSRPVCRLQFERERFAELKGRMLMTRFGGDCYGYCLLAAGIRGSDHRGGPETLRRDGADPHHRKRRRHYYNLGRRARAQRRAHHCRWGCAHAPSGIALFWPAEATLRQGARWGSPLPVLRRRPS